MKKIISLAIVCVMMLAMLSVASFAAPEEISVNLDGKVRKELVGKTLLSGMFNFFVYNNNDRNTVLLKGVNGQNGNVAFVDFDGVLI